MHEPGRSSGSTSTHDPRELTDVGTDKNLFPHRSGAVAKDADGLPRPPDAGRVQVETFRLRFTYPNGHFECFGASMPGFSRGGDGLESEYTRSGSEPNLFVLFKALVIWLGD